jgi:hypothetical protein
MEHSASSKPYINPADVDFIRRTRPQVSVLRRLTAFQNCPVIEPSQKYLPVLTSYSQRAVRDALDDLRTDNVISYEKQQRDGRKSGRPTNVYTLNYEKILAEIQAGKEAVKRALRDQEDVDQVNAEMVAGVNQVDYQQPVSPILEATIAGNHRQPMPPNIKDPITKKEQVLGVGGKEFQEAKELTADTDRSTTEAVALEVDSPHMQDFHTRNINVAEKDKNKNIPPPVASPGVPHNIMSPATPASDLDFPAASGPAAAPEPPAASEELDSEESAQWLFPAENYVEDWDLSDDSNNDSDSSFDFDQEPAKKDFGKEANEYLDQWLHAARYNYQVSEVSSSDREAWIALAAKYGISNLCEAFYYDYVRGHYNPKDQSIVLKDFMSNEEAIAKHLGVPSGSDAESVAIRAERLAKPAHSSDATDIPF